MDYTRLLQRGMLALAGEDRIAFLQGLITQDATKLEKAQPLYAALLSPQGKFLHDFFLLSVGDDVWLDADKEKLADLQKRLALYKLRSKVEIKTLPVSVFAAWGGEAKPAEGFQVMRDPRHDAMGYRLMGDATQIEKHAAAQGWQQVAPEQYERHRLSFAIPDGSRDLIADKSFLLEWGFEDLHGVDFRKGCYVGQEVTARSKYRGQVRKCVYRVRALSGQLPEAGTPVMAGDAEVGQMRSHAGTAGLALLRPEEVHKALQSRTALMAGDAVIEASVPEWINENAGAYAAG